MIRVSTDPAYPPQSSLDPETGEYVGFDIDVATEIADRLGVSIEWETPKWEAITAGNWQGRWDMSVGSMTVTKRQAPEVLDPRPPTTSRLPRSPYPRKRHRDVSTTSTARRSVSVRAAPTTSSCRERSTSRGSSSAASRRYQHQGLRHRLDLPGARVGSGRRGDVGDADDRERDREGRPMQLLGEPLFSEPLSVAFDKVVGTRPDFARRGRIEDRRGDAQRRHPRRVLDQMVRRGHHGRPVHGMTETIGSIAG